MVTYKKEEKIKNLSFHFDCERDVSLKPMNKKR